ncbi:MAG: MBL fold metallo-hydrolase [Christensenella sp.]|nr:MBL fold metallo-hydrolase [Christensenella sp.]
MEQTDNFIMLTANAGVLIKYHGKTILLDALHDRYTDRFSSVPNDLLEQVSEGEGEFAHIDVMAYTHDHPDHYSERWTRRFLKKHPDTELVSPIPDFAGRDHTHVLSAVEEHYYLNGIEINAHKLVHDGAEYAGIPNYGFVFEIDGFRILTLGDGMFEKNGIAALRGGLEIDLALLNFPFITLSRGREIVTQVIRPKEIIANHLPYEEKDKEGYRRSTQMSIRRNTILPKTVMLEDKLQRISIG